MGLTGKCSAPPPAEDEEAQADAAAAQEGCGVTMVCVGNIDSDDTLDVWSVSTIDRTSPDGVPIAAGTPFQHTNDVME